MERGKLFCRISMDLRILSTLFRTYSLKLQACLKSLRQKFTKMSIYVYRRISHYFHLPYPHGSVPTLNVKSNKNWLSILWTSNVAYWNHLLFCSSSLHILSRKDLLFEAIVLLYLCTVCIYEIQHSDHLDRRANCEFFTAFYRFCIYSL